VPATKHSDVNQPQPKHHCAFVGLIGRPNCGKSTLMNAIIGEDLALVTPLPQTTRKNLRGIYTSGALQLIFVDTPGIHKGCHAFNDRMVEESARIIRRRDVDIIGYIVDCSRPFGEEEDLIARLVKQSGIPAIIVFNKIDLCGSISGVVESFFNRYPGLRSFSQCSLSAVRPNAKERFLAALSPLLPDGPHLFPSEDLTDADMRFFAAEFIRKHVINATQDEVPHATFVEILSYRETENRHYVDAALHVETDGQKGIIIGKKGSLIQKIQRDAGRDLEKLTEVPVMVTCHVKISPHWRDNERFLREKGFLTK
jgi:GTPase